MPPARTARRFGIAFEGCGCRAAFHVGVIEWFAEHDLLPAAVAGASSGALIAGGDAVGRVADLRPVWTELFGSRVCDIGAPAQRPLALSDVRDRRRRRRPDISATGSWPTRSSRSRLSSRSSSIRVRAACADRARPAAARHGDPRILLPPRAVLAHGADRSPAHVRRRVAGRVPIGAGAARARGVVACVSDDAGGCCAARCGPGRWRCRPESIAGCSLRSRRCRSARSTSIAGDARDVRHRPRERRVFAGRNRDWLRGDQDSARRPDSVAGRGCRNRRNGPDFFTSQKGTRHDRRPV